MTVYELAMSLDRETRTRLVRVGLFPATLPRDLVVFEKWNDLVTKGLSKMDAYNRVSVECLTSEVNVRRIIARLNCPVSDWS